MNDPSQIQPDEVTRGPWLVILPRMGSGGDNRHPGTGGATVVGEARRVLGGDPRRPGYTARDASPWDGLHACGDGAGLSAGRTYPVQDTGVLRFATRLACGVRQRDRAGGSSSQPCGHLRISPRRPRDPRPGA
jgi:hypothetical protein